jgi:phosphoglycolate phosphatase-like HAD superfamily hydrolase
LLVKRIKAIITDIDATIIDNRERRVMAVEIVLGFRLDGERRKRAYNALTVEDVARLAGVELNEKALKEIIDVFLDDLKLYEFDRPAEGAVETLNQLSREGVAVVYVTGRPGIKYIMPFIEKMGFPRGPVYYERITGEGADEIKKTLLEMALKDNGFEGSEVVSLGDMPHDGVASRSLNIYSIGTTQVSGVAPEFLRPYFDEVITHISFLPSIIKRLDSGLDLNI